MEKEMELEVKRFMAGEIAKGTSLSDLQQLVNEKFNQKLTYMDIRIMASELDGIDWNAHDPKAQAKAKAEEKAAAKEADGAEEADGGDALEPDVEAEPGDGKTVVEVSKLVRPGTALSGTVTVSVTAVLRVRLLAFAEYPARKVWLMVWVNI